MDKLRQDIKSGNFEKVYLLFGQETYLLQQYKKKLKDAIAGDDTMNINVFSGKGIDVQEVRDAAMTMPFFAEKRLILIEDSGLFKGAGDEWAEFVKEIPESACVIFSEQELERKQDGEKKLTVDKRGKLYKAVKDKGYCCEMVKQTPAQLMQWCVRGFASNGLKITRQAAEAFLDMAGDDMENIRNEMEKLICYCAEKNAVELSDVETICTERVTNRVFKMVEEASRGNAAGALEMYYDLLSLKEPGMRILFLLSRQINQLYCTAVMTASGMSRDQIAASFKLSPYIAGKLQDQTRSFRGDSLLRLLKLCVSTEQAVKSGSMNERIAVETVLVSVSQRVC